MRTLPPFLERLKLQTGFTPIRHFVQAGMVRQLFDLTAKYDDHALQSPQLALRRRIAFQPVLITSYHYAVTRPGTVYPDRPPGNPA